MKKNSGMVITITRRNCEVRLINGEIVRARLENDLPALAVGDRVVVVPGDEAQSVAAMEPRKNIFFRSYFGRTKTLAANIDLVLVVAAPPPLFNPFFLDRAMVAAATESIPVKVLLNKKDLATSALEDLLAPYREAGCEIIQISALDSSSLAPIRELFLDPTLYLTLLCGLSGVGKSSLLNALIPEVSRPVGQVSEKSGQGKQTTTQSRCYPYPRAGISDLLVIDSPGLANFGLTHLSERSVAEGFPEIQEAARECRFSDCQHRQEVECEVKRRVEANLLARTRYESYLHIIDEIERSKPY